MKNPAEHTQWDLSGELTLNLFCVQYSQSLTLHKAKTEKHLENKWAWVVAGGDSLAA